MSNSSPLFANRVIIRIMVGLLLLSIFSLQVSQPAEFLLSTVLQPITKRGAAVGQHETANANPIADGSATLDVVFSSKPSVVGVVGISAETQSNLILPILLFSLLLATLAVWRLQRTV